MTFDNDALEYFKQTVEAANEAASEATPDADAALSYMRDMMGSANEEDNETPSAKPGEYGEIKANGVQMKPEDFSGMGNRGPVESALLNIQRDTGADESFGNSALDTVAAVAYNAIGRPVFGAMNKNLQALAKGTDVDGVPLEQLPDRELDWLMDGAGVNGGGRFFSRFLGGSRMSAAFRGDDNLMRQWDETQGAMIEDPAERKRARIEYARDIARGMIGQQETSKQRAEAELEGRDESMGSMAVRGLIEQGGYSLPFVLGGVAGGGVGSFALAGGLEGASRYNELRPDKLGMDADGNVVVEAAGDEAGTASGKALVRGIMAPAIEMVGGKIAKAAGGKLLGATIGRVPLFRKVGDRIAATNVGRAADKFFNKLNWFGKYTGVQGFPEEMAEELEDQVLDAAFGTGLRESEKADSTALERGAESFADFFKGENLKDLATSMLLMQLVGGGMNILQDRIASRHIDGVLREVAGVDPSELKYYTAEEKTAAFKAWADGLTEDEIADTFGKAAKQIDRMVKTIRDNVGENEFADTDADAPKFSAPMRTDEAGNSALDFQEVTDDAGRPVMRLQDAGSGITIDRIDMGDGEAQFRVTDAAGRTRAAETYEQAVARANQMLSGEYLSGAKRSYLESLTKPGRILSGVDVIAGDSLRDVLDEIEASYGAEAAASLRRRMGDTNGEESGQSFRYVLPDGRSGVAFVLDKIGSVQDMATAAMHEAGRHAGLDMLFDTPEKKMAFLKQIDGRGIDAGAAANGRQAMTPDQRRSFEAEIADIQRQYGLASREDVFKTPEAAEELFAYFTENEFGSPSLKSRFVAGLRKLYRDMFDADLSYNDSDLLAMAGEMNRRMRENAEAGRMRYRSAQERLGREDVERIEGSREDRRRDAERRDRMRIAQPRRNLRHPAQAVQERYENDRLAQGHDIDPETGGEGQLEDTEMPSGRTYMPNSPSRIRREAERQRRYVQRQLERFVDNRPAFSQPVERTEEERRLAQEARERRIMDKYPHLWMEMKELMPDAEDEDVLIACTRALREDAMNGTPGQAESDALVSYALKRLENGEDLTDEEVRGISARGFTEQMLYNDFGYKRQGDRWVYAGEYFGDRYRQGQRPQSGADILSQMRSGQRGRNAAKNGPGGAGTETGATTPQNGAKAPEGRIFAPDEPTDRNLRRTTAQNAKSLEDATRAAKDAQGRIDAEATARELRRGMMSDEARLALEESYPSKQENANETGNGTAEAPSQSAQSAQSAAGEEDNYYDFDELFAARDAMDEEFANALGVVEGADETDYAVLSPSSLQKAAQGDRIRFNHDAEAFAFESFDPEGGVLTVVDYDVDADTETRRRYRITENSIEEITDNGREEEGGVDADRAGNEEGPAGGGSQGQGGETFRLESATAEELKAEKERQRQRDEVRRRQNAPLETGTGEVGQTLLDLGGAQGEDGLFNQTQSAREGGSASAAPSAENVASQATSKNDADASNSDVSALTAKAQALAAEYAALPDVEKVSTKGRDLERRIEEAWQAVDEAEGVTAEEDEGEGGEDEMPPEASATPAPIKPTPAPSASAAKSPASFKRGDTVMLRDANGGYGAVTFVKDNGDGTATVQRRTANRVPYLPAKVENLTVQTGDLSASGMKRTLTAEEREAEKRGEVEDKANGGGVDEDGNPVIRWRRGDSTLDNLRRLASGKGSAEVRWRRAKQELRRVGMYGGSMSEHMARLREDTFADGEKAKEGAESIVRRVGDRVVKYRDARDLTQRDFDKIQWHNELFGDRTPYEVRDVVDDDSWSGNYRPPRIVLEQPYVEIREGGGAEARRRLVEDMRRRFGAENVTVKGDPASERMEIDAGPYHISDLKDLNVGIDERTGDYAVWDANIEKRKGADAGGGADVRWRRVTPAEDAAYMDAVERGDTETAQRLADDAAKRAGYDRVAYHGTPFGGWSVFDKSRSGMVSGNGRGGLISLTSSQEEANAYSKADDASDISDVMRRVNRILEKVPDGAWRDTEGVVDGMDGEPFSFDPDAFMDYVEQFVNEPDEYDFSSRAEYNAAVKAAERSGYIEAMESVLADIRNAMPEQSKVIDEALSEIKDIREQRPEVKKLAMRIENPYEASATPDTYGEVMAEAEKAIHSGRNDGAIVHLDNGTTRYLVKNESQIKSADPVTRDDAGNVIPLSQRFSRENADIRWRRSTPMFSTSEMDRVANAYGTTDEYVRGWILPDGRNIDLNPTAEGGWQDHDDIRNMLDEWRGVGGSAGTYDTDGRETALAAGGIRYHNLGEEAVIDVWREPTARQIDALYDYAEKGEFDPDAKVTLSFSPDESVTYDSVDEMRKRLVGDIRRHYNGTDVRWRRSGIYTGTAADYANESKQGGVGDGPSVKHIGTGEGSQVYGWGLYGSNVRGVAEGYAKSAKRDKALTQDEDTFQAVKKVLGENVSDDILQAIYEGVTGNSEWNEVKAWIKRDAEWDDEIGHEMLSVFRKKEGALKKVHEQYAAHENLYEQTFFTDRAPGDESHLLKWYEPVSKEQFEVLRKAGLNVEEKSRTVDGETIRRVQISKDGELLLQVKDTSEITGEDLYRLVAKSLGSEKAASEFLARAGIDGVKYPVDSYGGKGVKDGDKVGWNYVSFRDDNIQVDHKWRDGQLLWRRTYTPNPAARTAADNGPLTQREVDEINSVIPTDAEGRRGSTSRDRQERAAREQASRDAFARAFHNAGTWQRVGMLLDKNTRRDAWRAVKESAIRKMQDAGLDLRKYEVRRFERQFGKPMSRWTNAEKEQFVQQSTYYTMDRAYGRKENLSLKLNQDYVKPLKKQIADNGLDEAWTDERGEQNIGADGKPLSKLDVYLMALHGGEYNRMIAERTARAEGGPVLDGSGRSTEYWERQLARFRNEGFDRKAAEAVRLVHEMNKAALQQMVDSGRISQKQADKWNELSPNYVPLRNSDAARDLFEQLLFGGDIDEQTYRKAFSGTEYNHAAGRRSLADSPVINSIQQAEWAIARSMDNESRRSLAAQVRADPRMGTVVMQMSQSDFQEAQRQIAVFTQMEADGTITPARRDRLARLRQNVADTIAGNRLLPRRRMLNQNSEVQSVIDTQGLEDDPNGGWVAFKENGDTKYIKLGHHELVDANGNATGNMDELTGNRIAQFVKGQSFVKLGGVMRFVRNLSRGFGMLRTSLSPTFLFSNFLADNGQALRNVFHTLGSGAMRTFEGHAADMGRNGARASALRYLRGQLDPNRYAIDRFTKEWAEAGGQIGGFATESFGDIDERMAASLRRMQRRLSRGRGGWADALKDGARAIGERFQEWNSAIEMATRISAYATMRENGMGVNNAVSYARDVTVNFNRKGEWTPIFNALYVFSNANIQDMQRTGMTFTGSRAVQLNGTLFVLGLLSAALGFGQDDPDDEAEGGDTWENASEHRKQNGISFRVGGKVISLPLRGLARMPYYAGHKAFEALTGRRDASEIAGDIGSFMFSSALEPLSTTSSVAQSVAPSILRPAVELMENKSFTGAPIHRTKMSETQVASEMGRQSTSGAAVWLARALNSLTGGNRNRSGAIDVFPETLEQIGRGLAGTLGTDLMKGVALAKDIATFQTPATRDIPFVSRVASDMEKNSRRYHEAVTDFERDQKEYKDLAQEDPSVMASLRRKSPWFAKGKEAWYNELDSLRKLNKKLMIEETKADSEDRERLNELRMKTQGLFMWRLKHAPESDAPAKRAEYGQRNRLIDRMLRGRRAERSREEKQAEAEKRRMEKS